MWGRSIACIVLGACGFSGSAITDGGPPPITDDATDATTDAAPDGTVVTSNARAKPITIHGDKIAGTSTDFPVWIDVTDAEIAARAQTSGSDLFFTDAGGVALPYEIQHWDKPTSHLQAWVRVPTLSSGTSTVVYLRYGDATAAIAPSPAMVFSNHFAAVWHLDDPLASTTIVDATGMTPGTAAHLPSASAVTGVLGGGIAFNGTDSAIAFTNPFVGAATASSHTISAWVIAGSETKYGAVVVVGNSNPVQARWFHLNYGGLSVGFYGGDWQGASTAITNQTRLVHWVYDAPAKQSRMYLDGVQVGGTHTHDFSPASDIATQGVQGTIGNGPKPFGPNGNMAPANDGTLDEVRLAMVPRSGDWITTEFANQHDPGSFYSVGPEQAAP